MVFGDRIKSLRIEKEWTQDYVCKKLNISYEELRECDNLDPRNNSSHTFVYDNHPYTDSHCINKDIPAIAYTYDMELIIKAYEMNEEDKKKYKEE